MFSYKLDQFELVNLVNFFKAKNVKHQNLYFFMDAFPYNHSKLFICP